MQERSIRRSPAPSPATLLDPCLDGGAGMESRSVRALPREKALERLATLLHAVIPLDRRQLGYRIAVPANGDGFARFDPGKQLGKAGFGFGGAEFGGASVHSDLFSELSGHNNPCTRRG